MCPVAAFSTLCMLSDEAPHWGRRPMGVVRGGYLMQTRSALALLTTIALLAGCATAPAATATQDIAFIGGCWEQHDAGSGDFLRLLADREHPGGFLGDQSTIRNGKPTMTSRWTFTPDGTDAELASTTGPADAYARFTAAPDLAGEDRIIPPDASAAFFWERPGQLYLKVLREDDLLRISRHPAKNSDARYASSRKVYFEGRLSGCD